MMYNTPILFLVFNRPLETMKSFERIRNIKPKQLFIAADGPRMNIESDFLNCEKVRISILDSIDWDCEVKTLFQNENLGCGKAVQSALDWFFKQVEMGVIIEDDILPDVSFFSYAENLLYKFENNHSIFSINGCSLAYENLKYDYGLTKYFNMWGWATWRRSNDLVNKTWKEYNEDVDFKSGSKFIKTLSLPTIIPHKEWIYNWKKLFNATKSGKIDTWDYQWVYTCLKNQQYCIRPNINMINNIGFNENSTHTSQAPHVKLDKIKVNTLKISISNLHGKMAIDPTYEIINVAEYWNGIVINFDVFISKVKKRFSKMFVI